MIANLREAFKELVTENDWMDEETKKVAVEKVITLEYPFLRLKYVEI